MNFSKDNLKLYAVTDSKWANDDYTLASQVEDAIKGGCTMVQLREKNLKYHEFEKLALRIQKVCQKYNVPFIINDNIDIAIKINADGVHIGQNDIPADRARRLINRNMILGVSVQTVDQAIKAFKDGADYLGVGAIFSTTTKKDANITLFSTLKEINRVVSLPVVAIGGIKLSNIHSFANTNVAGVAIVSDIFGSKDIKHKCKSLTKEIDKYIIKEKR